MAGRRVVVIATPVDLARLVTIGKPAARVRCDLVETAGSTTVEECSGRSCPRSGTPG